MGKGIGKRIVVACIAILATVTFVAGCKDSGKSSSAQSSAAQSTSAQSSSASGTSDNQAVNADCPDSNTISFAKTKFVAHAGLAFGAFHRYLYKPYKAGTFSKGADGRVSAIVKGGLAALFIKREVRLASEDVRANPTLCKAIAAPLAAIGNTVQSAFDKVKSGDASGLDDVNSKISSITSAAGKDGVKITENENANINSKPS